MTAEENESSPELAVTAPTRVIVARLNLTTMAGYVLVPKKATSLEVSMTAQRKYSSPGFAVTAPTRVFVARLNLTTLPGPESVPK